ncbi:MAG: Xaa-Pro peptidase family protein [Defluviitaleaceae bacterium]|nr:Xaa-Pro peptidase family protein [Defluviitaleaceae bacterium]
MDKSFYAGNRQALYARLKEDALAVVFSGVLIRQTNDQYYQFFADRNFMYLTGIDQSEAVLLGYGGKGAEMKETLFIPAPDLRWEKWNGQRVKADEATEISGAQDVKYLQDFKKQLDQALMSGGYSTVYLPLVKFSADEPDSPAYQLAKYIRDRFPHIIIKDLMPHVKALRVIKKPCEIVAMRKAEEITGAGIVAMMRAAKPGMTELDLRAEYMYAIMKNGAALPGSIPIIATGVNNFCIHYHGHDSIAQDGDMILNDVGVNYNHMVTDVSRGWPVNGRFNDRQRALYQCAVETSKHMFDIIKPGMPMGDVDAIIKRVNYEHMRDMGLCKTWDDIGKYMWHGGAHHIGFDVHDVVEIAMDTSLAPGMIFCVDIGIYVEDWGIGFRLEDNCLVTEDGCENLSKDIPFTIEDIEAVMK